MSEPGEPRVTPRCFRRVALGTVLTVAALIALGSFIYSLSPIAFVEQGIRVVAAPIMAVTYRADMEYVEQATSRYRVGASPMSHESAEESWRRIEAAVPGLTVIDVNGENRSAPLVPFVYESPDAPYLRAFRNTYRLDELVKGSRSEYEAMLRLAAWAGTRWDHGTDEVPGGNQVCNPVAVVQAGQLGSKFWCEIAARTMVHAATALGWQARVITASRDGYSWEHAVAELWSTQFRKWFVIDADFNVVFESGGVPLSAYQLAHEGERLQETGELQVVRFAPAKESLPLRHLMPFFAYVHVDMRNDWCSRSLRRGSPAGGDVATWWTARSTLGPILTAATRVDDPIRFDWPVNVATIRGIEARTVGRDKVEIDAGVSGYGPEVESIEFRFNGAAWTILDRAPIRLSLAPGRHSLSARVVMKSGATGPEARLILDFAP